MVARIENTGGVYIQDSVYVETAKLASLLRRQPARIIPFLPLIRMPNRVEAGEPLYPERFSIFAGIIELVIVVSETDELKLHKEIFPLY